MSHAFTQRSVVGNIDWSKVHGEHREYYEAHRSRLASLPESERRTVAAAELAEGINAIAGPWSEDLVVNAVAAMRMCCFSDRHNGILSWSHYGDEHRGVAIAFHSSVLHRAWGPHSTLDQVVYSDSLPELASVDEWVEAYLTGCGHPIVMEKLPLLFLTKARDWSHEHEWRFCARTGFHGGPDAVQIPFPREAVAAVYLGCQASPDTRKQILGAVTADYPGVVVTQLKRSRTRFSLEGDK